MQKICNFTSTDTVKNHFHVCGIRKKECVFRFRHRFQQRRRKEGRIPLGGMDETGVSGHEQKWSVHLLRLLVKEINIFLKRSQLLHSSFFSPLLSPRLPQFRASNEGLLAIAMSYIFLAPDSTFCFFCISAFLLFVPPHQRECDPSTYSIYIYA